MSDRVLLITGASSGIGAATARRASAEGYRLTLAGRRLEPLEALSDELGGPDRSLAVRCDVTSWEEQQAMVASTVSAFGQLDAVLANAGYGAASGFRNESPEHWRGMVLTNVLGPALTIRATVDAITARRGHVLLTGSVASRRPRPGSLYATTKSAVAAMAEA
ncbi:MAG: SDR family oxidoreductase, partial [Gaiellales bacterium]